MESAAENRDYLIQILDKLCFIVSAGQGDKENRKSEYPKREAEIAIDEMSEEAFEAFLSL